MEFMQVEVRNKKTVKVFLCICCLDSDSIMLKKISQYTPAKGNYCLYKVQATSCICANFGYIFFRNCSLEYCVDVLYLSLLLFNMSMNKCR